MNTSVKVDNRDWQWQLWFTCPIYPYNIRRTLRTEVVKDTIWTFDQLQGIFYVVVPIRMTLVKLATGGLLVYAPIAPTAECLRLVQELVAEHGEIKYIILPTVSGIEHKVFVAPFARNFPTADVYVAPDQWSYPLNLPLAWLGFPKGRTHILPLDPSQTPFAAEFDYAILSINLGLGRFGEVAFFHRRSQTLLVTDAIVSIPIDPPAIVQLDPYPLLFHAQDDVLTAIEDTADQRRKGWQRICLFTFYFVPSALQILGIGATIKNAWQSTKRSRQAYFGLFPFQWQDDWQDSFTKLHGNGQLLVAPILQSLILNRAPQQTIAWADQIASWDFNQIIACHLAGAIATTPPKFRQAFSFLEEKSPTDQLDQVDQDFKTLKQIETNLNKYGILLPSPNRRS